MARSMPASLLSGPTDVAVDGKGNVYVAEAGDDRVRMTNAAGILSTVAGGGSGEMADLRRRRS
jgi:hypothetical protein